MKIKTLDKKLSLTKSTIVNLNDSELSKAKGGLISFECITEEPICVTVLCSHNC
jgi:hypothetical protein